MEEIRMKNVQRRKSQPTPEAAEKLNEADRHELSGAEIESQSDVENDSQSEQEAICLDNTKEEEQEWEGDAQEDR